jgi:hypothetical protein
MLASLSMALASDNREMENTSHRFRVTVQRRQVEQFDQVVSRNAGNTPDSTLSVPLTFPATWYGLNEVQSSIIEKVGGSVGPGRFVLLHLEQTIEMHGQLEIDETYELRVQVGDLRSDNKLKVSAQVCNMQEATVASMNGLFAVVRSTEEHP